MSNIAPPSLRAKEWSGTRSCCCPYVDLFTLLPAPVSSDGLSFSASQPVGEKLGIPFVNIFLMCIELSKCIFNLPPSLPCPRALLSRPFLVLCVGCGSRCRGDAGIAQDFTSPQMHFTVLDIVLAIKTSRSVPGQELPECLLICLQGASSMGIACRPEGEQAA